MSIAVRPLTTYEEINQLASLQEETWGRPDGEIIPAHLLFALHKQGAALLGAVRQGEEGDQIVGFLLSVLGTVESLKQRRDPVAAARLKMFTVVLGVLPDYRGQGLGLRLKKAERQFALRIGVRLVTSAFDPLDSHCAHLHIGQLGAISHQYWRKFAGAGGGADELAADRLHAEWWVTSHRAEGRTNQKRRPLALEQLLGGGARLVNPARVNANGRLEPGVFMDPADTSLKLVEIPAAINALAQTDEALSQSWRVHIREVFETLFLDQFMITDFVEHVDDEGRRRSFYMLAHRNV